MYLKKLWYLKLILKKRKFLTNWYFKKKIFVKISFVKAIFLINVCKSDICCVQKPFSQQLTAEFLDCKNISFES